MQTTLYIGKSGTYIGKVDRTYKPMMGVCTIKPGMVVFSSNMIGIVTHVRDSMVDVSTAFGKDRFAKAQCKAVCDSFGIPYINITS